MPEKKFNNEVQLEYGFQLIDYNANRNKVKSAFESGKISEERYNEYLMVFNDEERIQQTKIDNYKNAIKGYNETDLLQYNAYNLIMNGQWDEAAGMYGNIYTNPGLINNTSEKNVVKKQETIVFPLRKLVDAYNKTFTGNDGNILQEKTINLNSYWYDALRRYGNNNNIDYTSFGIYTNDSNKSITIPHDKKAFMTFCKAVRDIRYTHNAIQELWWDFGGAYYYDNIGKQIETMTNEYNKTKNKYNNPVLDDVTIHSSLDYIDNFAFVENGQIKTANGIGSFQEMQNYIDRVTDNVKAGETKFNREEIYNTFYNQLVGTNAANFPVWTINGNEFKRESFKGGEFEPNTNDKHRNQIKEDIAWAMQNQSDDIMIRPAGDGENYGHVIYIPARENKDGGKQVHPGYTVFVPNFFERNAIERYKNDLGVIAKDEIKTIEGYKMPNYQKSVLFQGTNCQGTYQITQAFDGSKIYLYNNSEGKQFNLNQLFGSEDAAKYALWQVVAAQHKLNTYTNIGLITEDWFDGLMNEYSNVSNATTQEILSILGEQSIDDTRRSLRNAYRTKFK